MSMDHKQSNNKENKLKGKKGSGTYPEGGLDGMILRDSGSKKTEYPLPEPSAIQITDPLNTARVELITTRAPPDTKISSPWDVEELMKGMGDYDRERLKVIHLDTKNQVLAKLTRGLNETKSLGYPTNLLTRIANDIKHLPGSCRVRIGRYRVLT